MTLCTGWSGCSSSGGFLHMVVHVQLQLLDKGGVHFIQPFQRCGYCSRAITRQGWHLITEIQYIQILSVYPSSCLPSSLPSIQYAVYSIQYIVSSIQYTASSIQFCLFVYFGLSVYQLSVHVSSSSSSSPSHNQNWNSTANYTDQQAW